MRDEYRRKHLGDRLLSLALDWSAGRGLRAIDVEAHERFDPNAVRALYGKKGFHEIKRTRLTKQIAG